MIQLARKFSSTMQHKTLLEKLDNFFKDGYNAVHIIKHDFLIHKQIKEKKQNTSCGYLVEREPTSKINSCCLNKCLHKKYPMGLVIL